MGLKKSKTIWAMIAAIAAAIGAYTQGELSLFQTILTTMGALGGMAGRHAIAKVGQGLVGKKK